MPRAPAEPEPCDSEWDRLILSGAGYFVGAGLVFGKLE